MSRRVLMVVAFDLDDKVADDVESGDTDRQQVARRVIEEALGDLVGEGLGPIGRYPYVHSDAVSSALDILERQYMKDLKDIETSIESSFIEALRRGEYVDPDSVIDEWVVPSYRRDARVAVAGGTVPDLYVVAGQTIRDDLEDRFDWDELREEAIGEELDDDEDEDDEEDEEWGDDY